jgi:hypothetical protein
MAQDLSGAQGTHQEDVNRAFKSLKFTFCALLCERKIFGARLESLELGTTTSCQHARIGTLRTLLPDHRKR